MIAFAKKYNIKIVTIDQAVKKTGEAPTVFIEI